MSEKRRKKHKMEFIYSVCYAILGSCCVVRGWCNPSKCVDDVNEKDRRNRVERPAMLLSAAAAAASGTVMRLMLQRDECCIVLSSTAVIRTSDAGRVAECADYVEWRNAVSKSKLICYSHTRSSYVVRMVHFSALLGPHYSVSRPEAIQPPSSSLHL